MLLAWLGVSAVAFVAALVVDFDTAANVISQLGADPGDVALFGVLMLLVVPNAVVFSGSYLLGPGFTVGVGTMVSPPAVAIGPLPMFPLLAALPDDGPAPGWTSALMVLPLLVAVLAAVEGQRRLPTLRWEEGALRGCVGGVLAGAVFAVLAALAGGAVGPGRMRDVGPLAGDVLVHAVTAFGLGGLLGGALITWWQRRAAATEAHDSIVEAATQRSPSTCGLLDCGSCPPPPQRGSSSSSPVPAPTSRRCSTPARTRRTARSVVAVGADRDGIEGLERAERAGVPTFVRAGRGLRLPRGLGRAR